MSTSHPDIVSFAFYAIPILIYFATDVYLSLNGTIIPDHGYVMISDIGSNDDTALICHTNRPANLDSNRLHSGGDWFSPNGTKVKFETTPAGGSTIYVPGFRRNRGPMMVRLLRNIATGTPPEGIYECVIEDDTSRLTSVYVGLYNRGRGTFTNVHARCFLSAIYIHVLLKF